MYEEIALYFHWSQYFCYIWNFLTEFRWKNGKAEISSVAKIRFWIKYILLFGSYAHTKNANIFLFFFKI